MWRIIKILLVLLILAVIAFIAYAYIGPIFFRADFTAPTQLITETITLEVQ